MIAIPQSKLNEFKEAFDKYRLYVNSCNIYHQAIKMVNKHHCFLNREDYNNYYLNITVDIELESSPIDSFIPDHGQLEQNDHVKRLFIVNRDTPEYVRIAKRVTLDDLYNTFPPTHDVVNVLKEDPSKLIDVVDDVYIYYCVNKYLDMIDKCRLMAISCMKDVIEYVVNEISYDKWKEYLISKRTNEDKINKYLADNIFDPDYSHTIDYYKAEHEGIPSFDVSDLIDRLCTNIIVKTDIYMIIAVYLILTFSKVDITNGNFDNAPCAAYVRDVLSRL